MRLDLRVMRQGIDPTAESSLHALRDIMRLAVLAVEHGELLRFDVVGDVDVLAARRALEKAASRAGRYVNLNRDAMLWDEDSSTQTAPENGTHVDVWVQQRTGPDARALHWFRQHSGLGIDSVQRGRWYRIHLATTREQEARRLAEEMTLSRTRGSGLLANPHAESISILRIASNGNRGVRHVV